MDISLGKLKYASISIYCWFILFSILTTNTTLLYSQSPAYISGRILDGNSNAPVPFATIWLQSNQLGVIANAEADFRFRNDIANIEDSIIISCIGYERKTISFKDLIGDELRIIYLTPAVYELEEAQVISLVKNVNSKVIISKAILRITKNHPIKPFNYISYYRDYQKRNGEYLNLNEAIIQTLDVGFRAEDGANEYILLDYVQNLDFRRIQLSPYYVSNAYLNFDKQYKIVPRARMGDHYGNEFFVLLVHDPIRNYNSKSFSFIENFSRDFLDNHIFSKPKPVFNNDLLLYKIEFTTNPRIVLDTLFVDGSIYIQPEDYSIHKIEYACKYQSVTGDKSIYNVNVEYGYEKSIDSKMKLKYISFNNAFNVVDTTDKDYFQVLDSYWLTRNSSRPTMVFKFNRTLDIESAIEKQNYQIKIIEDPVRIREITAEEDSLIISLQRLRGPDVLEEIQVSMFNIKDIYGNHLNQRRMKEFVQYRELFVQDYNDTLGTRDSCFIEPLPLEKNCISNKESSQKYWMNSPIGFSEEK